MEISNGVDLSVVIVSFNTRDELRQCLRSVFASQTRYCYEIFVIDNNSQDDSAEMVEREFPRVRLIRNPGNNGFAAASNRGIKQASGRYVLLLNSDVEVEPGSFDKMISFMDNNREVGISGCRVEKEDGSLDLACRRSFPTISNSLFRISGLSFLFPQTRIASYNLTYLPEDQILEIDSVMGAFLFIRRETIDKIGLLDENFFMYGEDLDWCWRAKENGWKVVYLPLTRVIHRKGSSSRRLPARALYEFHRAMELFYDKHYRQNYNSLINFFVKAGIWARYFFKVLENILRREKYVSK